MFTCPLCEPDYELCEGDTLGFCEKHEPESPASEPQTEETKHAEADVAGNQYRLFYMPPPSSHLWKVDWLYRCDNPRGLAQVFIIKANTQSIGAQQNAGPAHAEGITQSGPCIWKFTPRWPRTCGKRTTRWRPR